jgi:2-methylisocitrate lyase-like PEP mutase family enzyme
MKKTALMRKALQEEQLLVTAGVHDALSACLVEQAGFRFAFLSGFGFEASLLGKPDVGLLTMTEIANHARNIDAAVGIPLLADAEAGYGGPSNIQRTVREFERAGLAGLFIEDQPHPNFCGSLRKFKKIIPEDEMAMKVRCAIEAREDPDFIICARTDADIVSMDEQIRRCKAYLEAGADMVTALPASRAEFQQLANEIKAPLWLYLHATIDVTPDDLRRMGIHGVVIYPVEPLFAATQAMQDVLRELKETGTVRKSFAREPMVNYKEFFSLINLRSFVETEGRFPYLKDKS